ncbi:MAG TPA: ATP-binding protein, partial [Thermodesulfobacteriota bacterium]|nr:ATP-binding protein [Thermodesulfobacteriota bacterium]
EEFMGTEASSLFELDEAKELLFVRLSRGPGKEPLKGITVQLGEGIVGHVVQSGKPMVIQDVTREKRFTDRFDRMTGFKTKSMICVPLILRNRPVGAIEVINKKSGRRFARADLELLLSMAQFVAIAMENAQLYRKMSDQFHSTSQELRLAQKKLIRAERLAAMSHLAEGVAHEIRNPIMTIGGFARRIKAELTDARFRKYIDIIMEETLRLENLVTHIHDFLDVQAASPHSEPVAQVIEEALGTVETEAAQLNVTIIRDFRLDNLSIPIDRRQIRTALYHLIANAIDAMPKGGTLTIAASQEKDALVISVQDTGCGIPKELLDSIYDPFFTSKTKGTGLGLTMVHQIIMNHRGEIRIRSEVDKGTIATIRLPIREADSGERS